MTSTLSPVSQDAANRAAPNVGISTLIGHDLRATRKTLTTVLGLLLLGSLASVALKALRIPILGDLGFGLGIFASAAIVPVALVLLAVHYWRTMYGREGYFTMAIPVRGRTLYLSKTIYGCLVALVAALLTGVGLAAVTVGYARGSGMSFADAFGMLSELLWNLEPAWVWFIGATLLVSLLYTIVAGSALMTIGAEGRYNHLGIAAPVIGGVILYVTMQAIGLAVMLFLPFGFRLTGPDAGSFVAQGMWDDFVAAMQAGGSTSEPGVIGLGMLPLTVIVTVMLGWWAIRSIERRTSLR